MKKLVIALASVSLLAAPAAVVAKPKLTPQQQLDKLLQGRVAGKPVNCISHFDSRDMRVIDKTAIVYNAGNVIYVNRTTHPAHLDSDDILVSKRSGSMGPCSLDIVETHDQTGHFWNGSVGLVEFVPYRKVPKGT